MRVMSSSSENRPSSASTDSLMLLTSCATSGSWMRWRSASANRPIACSGWRRSWLAAVKNCVFARFATSASWRAASATVFSARNWAASRSVRSFRRDRRAVERLAVVAAEQHGHRHRHRHHHRELPVERALAQGDAGDRRHEDEQHEQDEEAELRRQDRHAGDAEGVDDEDQRELVRAAERPEEPGRGAPERARGEHAGLPGAQPVLQAGDGGGLVAREAHGQPGAHQPDDGERHAPDDAQQARRDVGEDELDDDRADRVAGERRAVEREGAADVVAQQQEAVERRLAARHRRRPARAGSVPAALNAPGA